MTCDCWSWSCFENPEEETPWLILSCSPAMYSIMTCAGLIVTDCIALPHGFAESNVAAALGLSKIDTNRIFLIKMCKFN